MVPSHSRADAVVSDAAMNWRDFSDDRLSPPLAAALRLFARYGYHGTSIRSIAKEADLSVAGLYHHYPSKQVLLEELVELGIEQLLRHTEEALRQAGPDPRRQFDDVVECLLLFHMERREGAFVTSSEMRSMDDATRRAHVARRDRQQAMLRDIIERGVAAGVFSCEYSVDAARAVASLCVSVADWYRPDGPLSMQEVARRYQAFARGVVNSG